MRKFFRYIEPMWVGNDGKISLRSIAAIALLVDFVINVHNNSNIILTVLKLINQNKTVDPALIGSLPAVQAQTVMLIGIEAGLIAALMALKAYQPIGALGQAVQIEQPQPAQQVQQPIKPKGQAPVTPDGDAVEP